MRQMLLCHLLHRLVLSGLLLLATPTQAENYLVGVEEIPYLPYYNYEANQFGGMARDLLDAFAAANGHQFTYRALPVKRLYVEFLAGNLDLKFPDHPGWTAADKAGRTIHYSAPIIPYTDGVMVLPARKGAGIGALRSLGTVRGFTTIGYLDAIRNDRIRLYEIETFRALIQANLERRIDGSYFNVLVAESYLRDTLKQPGALVFDPDLPHTSSHYHLSSLKHPQLIAQFDAFLAGNPALLRSLRSKWNIPDK